MIIILTLPLHSIFGHRNLGFPFPLLRLQLIIEVPRELEFRLPFLDVPRLVRRSGMRLYVLLDLEDVLEAGIEVEQE